MRTELRKREGSRGRSQDGSFDMGGRMGGSAACVPYCLWTYEMRRASW